MYSKHDIEAVKSLGKRIGYGAMMDIASGLWAKDLKDSYGIPFESTGAFVTTCLPQLKKRDREYALSRLKSWEAYWEEKTNEAQRDC